LLMIIFAAALFQAQLLDSRRFGGNPD